jgi:hypothetical protein
MMQQNMQQQMPNYQAPPSWLAMAAPSNMPQVSMQPSMMGYPQQQQPMGYPQQMQQQPQVVQTTAGPMYALPNGQYAPVNNPNMGMQQPAMQMQQPMGYPQQMQQPAPGWGDIKNLVRA